MKTIAFFNHKGGVGKTTMLFNVAIELGRLGKRTLMVDFDAQARTIIGVMGAAASAEAYVNDAARERRSSIYWLVASLTLFLAAAVAAIVWVSIAGLDPSASTAEVVEFVLTRLALSVGFTAGGVLCLKQHQSHRRREEFSRRLANELTAFRPFIGELPDDKRDNLIENRAKEYFVGSEGAMRAMGSRDGEKP